MSLQPIVLTESLGVLREVLPPLDLDAEDALCLGAPSPQSQASALVVNFTGGDYCFLCWPKNFSATEYVWVDGRLLAGTTFTTKHRHSNWRGALRELGLSCPLEVSQSSFDR